ncbi:hypothetical protein COMA2_20321 [Candidatus Nitrospira nitrificans]|jgi:hypothetical protein|uniref:Uncharacterized protein n=1 Tax=Candidatus Nitrospira nitrificans TaxID=1742973 RepID=A0A0S4LHW7_9BACT|nr:hypothetical protein COMA2_20321 [Candidatus Nitrospira nitrificans]
MASESADPIERWTVKRRLALVVSMLKGETSRSKQAPSMGCGRLRWRTDERTARSRACAPHSPREAHPRPTLQNLSYSRFTQKD